jgi:hypothetical protein
MKSFEQIARAMFEAAALLMGWHVTYTWDDADWRMQKAWIAAAQAAHREITEVH